jgi:hypothetical protein
LNKKLKITDEVMMEGHVLIDIDPPINGPEYHNGFVLSAGIYYTILLLHKREARSVG